MSAISIARYRGHLSERACVDGQRLLQSERNGNYYLATDPLPPEMISMMDAARWLRRNHMPLTDDLKKFGL